MNCFDGALSLEKTIKIARRNCMIKPRIGDGGVGGGHLGGHLGRFPCFFVVEAAAGAGMLRTITAKLQ